MIRIVERLDTYPKEDLVTLSSYDRKYKKVKRLVTESLPKLTITGISKVENSFLKAMYQLKKSEYETNCCDVTELKLLHATDACDVNSIIRDNFDWRRVHRAKYGIGTSFSPIADYANCHCNRRNGNSRAFLITKVIVANEETGDWGLEIPPKDVDTTTDVNNLVYVKYHDNEFLPKYVVYYECPSISESKYYGW